jgi:hypothetical protein
MIEVTTYNTKGLILQNMTLLDEAEADLNGAWVVGHWDSAEYYVVGKKAEKRPSLDLPEEQTLPVNQDWDVGTLPEGTAVYIDGVIAGETDDTALTMSFPLAREYAVKFDPPFPYKPSEVKVTVNETNA